MAFYHAQIISTHLPVDAVPRKYILKRERNALSLISSLCYPEQTHTVVLRIKVTRCALGLHVMSTSSLLFRVHPIELPRLNLFTPCALHVLPVWSDLFNVAYLYIWIEKT